MYPHWGVERHVADSKPNPRSNLKLNSQDSQVRGHGIRNIGLAVATLFAVAAAGAPHDTAPYPQVASEAVGDAASEAARKVTPEEPGRPNPFARYSDAALTEAAGNIQTFDPVQRRALFTELRRRMTEKGRRPRIKIEGQYGRVVRSSDGSVHMETVRIYQRGQGREFGSVNAAREVPVPEQPPANPVIRVEDSSQ